MPIHILTTTQFAEYWQAHPKVRRVVVAPAKTRGTRLKTFRRIWELRRAARPERGAFDCVVSDDSYAAPEHFALLDALAPRS